MTTDEQAATIAGKRRAFTDYSCAIRGFMRWTRVGTDYEEGEYVHPAGIVTVLRQWGTYKPCVRMDFAHGGRLHIRTWSRNYSRRGCAMFADRFVRDILP
jgi:hypothetical protein